MYKSQSIRGCQFLKVQHQDPDTALSIEYGGKKGAASVPDTDSEHTSDYKAHVAGAWTERKKMFHGGSFFEIGR